jgi:hypothetical protein
MEILQSRKRKSTDDIHSLDTHDRGGGSHFEEGDSRDGSGSEPKGPLPDSAENVADEKNPPSQASSGPQANELADRVRWLYPRDDVANELDMLDMMDEDERIRTLRSVLARFAVPRLGCFEGND